MQKSSMLTAVSALSWFATLGGMATAQSLHGKEAFGDWQRDKPGTIRLIRPEDLPKPGATPSAANVSQIVARPPGAAPQVPPGFKVELLAEGLRGPRIVRGAPPGGLKSWTSRHALGAAWSYEADRAAVLSFDPDGKDQKIFASGIRNCVGLAIQPQSGTPWCSTNERDGFGDNLVPDYVTRISENAFYGWPWFYIGGNEDPRHAGERPDLKGKVTIPDVLIQAHSASMGLIFYEGTNFPSEYRGDAFAAEHGSWNRSRRTGYKIVRIRLKDGVPTGEYEDFVTGFVVNGTEVWGRPVGVAIAHDGALLVSEDGNGTIWRISH